MNILDLLKGQTIFSLINIVTIDSFFFLSSYITKHNGEWTHEVNIFLNFPFLLQEIIEGGDGQSAEALASGHKRTCLWDLG